MNARGKQAFEGYVPLETTGEEAIAYIVNDMNKLFANGFDGVQAEVEKITDQALLTRLAKGSLAAKTVIQYVTAMTAEMALRFGLTPDDLKLAMENGGSVFDSSPKDESAPASVAAVEASRADGAAVVAGDVDRQTQRRAQAAAALFGAGLPDAKLAS